MPLGPKLACDRPPFYPHGSLNLIILMRFEQNHSDFIFPPNWNDDVPVFLTATDNQEESAFLVYGSH